MLMCDKPTVAIGAIRVCSTATSLFMIPEKRILLPNTLFLLHKSGRANINHATEDELRKIYQETVATTKLLFDPVIHNSLIPESMLAEKCCENDWTLTEDEIKKFRITTMDYDREVVKKLIMG